MIVSTRLSESEGGKLSRAATSLWQVERPLRVLRTSAQGSEMGRRFFAASAAVLPQVEYTPIEPSDTLQGVAAACALIKGASPVHVWRNRLSSTIETTARLLATVGSREFCRYSLVLFG